MKATNLKQSLNALEGGIIRVIEIDLDNQINLISRVGAVERVMRGPMGSFFCAILGSFPVINALLR